jgi:allantoate deiminase
MAEVDAARAVANLRELARLTGNDDGAQRVAWTDTWKTANDWLRDEVAGIDGVGAVEADAAGNLWVTAPGDSERFVVIGGHLDSVPNGGWLDGALNVLAGLEVMRALAGEQRPLSLKLVSWADEEGARFGRSLLGSSACAGTLEPDSVRGLTDRDGVALPDALGEHGVDLDRALDARQGLDGAAAYLELHIEQGPVLEQLDRPLGAVLGTFGVERHAVRFTGQHAHAGSTPMEVRRDAFLAAARSALAFREDALERDDVRATAGIVKVSPGIVTAFNGTCELSLDQRALDADVLADMLATAQEASRRIAEDEGCEAEWERIWQIEPIPFDAHLIDLADEAIAAVAGTSHRLPSGPLHDAAEMARVMPTVMVFVKSLRGLSHTKEEDTPDEDLELSVRALYELTRRTLRWAQEA